MGPFGGLFYGYESGMAIPPALATCGCGRLEEKVSSRKLPRNLDRGRANAPVSAGPVALAPRRKFPAGNFSKPIRPEAGLVVVWTRSAERARSRTQKRENPGRPGFAEIFGA